MRSYQVAVRLPRQRRRPCELSTLLDNLGSVDLRLGSFRQMLSNNVNSRQVSGGFDKERAFEEQVLTRYRLYSGLFLGLPFKRLTQLAQLLPVFTEHCRRLLREGIAPSSIVDRFFAETPHLREVARNDVLFLFVQLVERQIVLFDAIEESGFAKTHDLEAPGSVSHLVESVTRDDRQVELSQLLERTATRIVLTAHPTQFYPSTVQGIIEDLRTALADQQSAEVERLLLQLGKTHFSNRSRPTPVEEAARVLDVIADVFYEVLPGIVHQMLLTAHGRVDLAHHLPKVPNLQVGFWPGGDRDGNPYVTASVTLEVAKLLKRRVLGCYLQTATALCRRLTFEGAREAVLAVVSKLEDTRQSTLELSTGTSSRPGYVACAELMVDLIQLRQILLKQHQGLYLDLVDRFVLQVHLFGFHFSSIDVRQNSDVFFEALRETVCLPVVAARLSAETVAHVLECQDSSALSLSALQQLLEAGVELPEEGSSALLPLSNDTIKTLRLIPNIQANNGLPALHRVIISHAHAAADVMTVLVLAGFAGLPLESLAVDVVPLFESIEDLVAAPQIMAQLLDNAVYRTHLSRRGNQQTVMMGFSDGTKDGGYLTANLQIRQAKRALTTLGRRNGVELVFFDGRGGPPARGGGNTHRFYRSIDLGIDQWQQQLTIQGQTINSNFGSRDLARYHIEQLYTANLQNLLWPTQAEDPPSHFDPLLAELSSLSNERYLLLRDDSLLLEFLANHSPLPLFDHLTIGSRPVKRRRTAQLELDHLRAIPYVATWSVLKLQVPGFYGLGYALSTVIDQDRLSDLRDLYRASRFFRTLLDNAAMGLLKSRLDIHQHLEQHSRYAPLFRKIAEEYTLARRTILQVSEQSCLLASDPINRRSIEQREEITLPLLVIVQSAYLAYLECQRKGTGESPEAVHYRKLSLKGIAAIINATRNAA